MGITNLILLFVGIFVILIGAAAFLHPNIARFINAPGGPRVKASIALIIGVILLVIGMFIQLPG